MSKSYDFPVTICVPGTQIAPGLVDTVSTNIRLMLNALGVSTVAILYYRVRSTSIPEEASHLFVAVDEKQSVIKVTAARLALITSTIDTAKLKEYTASITSDPLGALIANGERINRFPAIFGFKGVRGEKNIYDRRTELEVLRRDGYFALTFLPVAGVDRRIQLSKEIASLWGYSVAGGVGPFEDILILRNEAAERYDLGGVPDETWLNYALSRVHEDHLPVVEIDGLWMGTLKNQYQLPSRRAIVFYAVLDWVRMRRLPYITARTFHCYVRRDLSAVVALGSLRDRQELVAWLEAYPYDTLIIKQVNEETEAASLIYSGPTPSRSIAVKQSEGGWLVVSPPSTLLASKGNLESALRAYYSDKDVCKPPVTPADIQQLKFADLLKVVRIAECEAAISGVCLLPTMTKTEPAWSSSHRAYRSAIRSQSLRTHDTLGVYRMGPYASPFFAFEVHQYVSMPSESRYKPVVSQVRLAPDHNEGEDNLLKSLVGTVWLLTIQEDATATTPATEYDVLQVATDRDEDSVKRILFSSWRSGYLIGIWCRVLLTHRESLSVSVAGGTVDPLVAHAGDSVVDGDRWLDVVEKAIADCSIKCTSSSGC